MNIDVVSNISIRDLYRDKRTWHLVVPYIKVLIKRRMIKI